MTTSEAKTFTPDISNEFPLPPAKERKVRAKSVGTRVIYPFETMQVGDSFLLPAWAEASRPVAALSRAHSEQRLPKSFKITIRETADGVRVWRCA